MMKLVVDWCLYLLDVEVVDMVGIGDLLVGRNKLVDVIMVCGGGGNEFFIYWIEKLEDFEKGMLIFNICKIVEELCRNFQFEREVINKVKEIINYFVLCDFGFL